MPIVPTFQDLYDRAKAEAQGRDSRLTDFEAGSALDALAGAGSILADDVLRVALARFQGGFVATAKREDLDARIVDFGGPARLTPSSAVAPLTLTRGSYVGAYTVTAGTEITGDAPDGTLVTFTVDDDIVLGLAASEATGTATCSDTGRSGNVPADTLTSISGLPAALAISNAQRAAGGSDGEPYTDAGDDAYRARYELWHAAQQRGTPAALEYGARLVPGVTFATVDEDAIAAEDGGYVAVYIGDPDGAGNDALVDDVQAELESWRAAGVLVLVYAAEREELAFEITATVKAGSGLTEDDFVDAALGYLDQVKPAKPMYLSAMESALHVALGDDLLEVDITCTERTGERVITPTEAYQAIRSAADGSDITVTITET